MRKAIQTKNIVPEFSLKSGNPQQREIQRHFQNFRHQRSAALPRLGGNPASSELTDQLAFSYTVPDRPASSPAEPSDEAPVTGAVVQPSLWQVHNRYIISQIKSGLVIIDQHVAHERILYEKFLKFLQEERPAPAQQLLFSQTLELSLEDYLIYSEIKEWLAKIGFSVNELSGRTILIESIPADVKAGYEGKILLEIIDYYRENQNKKYQPHEKIAAAFACKSAIKSGEKLSVESMTALIDQLFATKEPFFCPHGRPVIVNLSLEELDRKFKRIK